MKATGAHRHGVKVYAELDGDLAIYIHQSLTVAQAEWLVNAVNKKGEINPQHWMPADLYWEAKSQTKDGN